MTKNGKLVKIVQTKIPLAQNLQVPFESENIFLMEIHKGFQICQQKIKNNIF